MGAWLFAGDGSGVSKPQLQWTTGNGQWQWSSSTFVTGDFNGDGYTDAIGFYNYGNGNLGAWLLPGSPNGVGKPQLLWTTGNGQWNMNDSAFVVGDFNGDGKPDVVGFYNEGNGNLAAFLFPGNGAGIGKPQVMWSTGTGQWDMTLTKFVTGDFTGDGKTDVIGFYNEGNNDLAAWLFSGNGAGIAKPQILWSTGKGQWDWRDM